MLHIHSQPDSNQHPASSIQYRLVHCSEVTFKKYFVCELFEYVKRLVHPADREMCLEHMEAAVKRRESYEIEYRIITAAGRKKWIWEKGEGVFKGESCIANEGFLTDITAKKAAEKALIEAERLKSDFITIASHELRTPLNITMLSTTSLLAGYIEELSEDVRKSVKRIRYGLDQILNIIDNFLDLSRIEAEKTNLVFEEIALVRLVRKTVADTAILLERNHHRLNIDIAEPFLVNVDAKRFTQVLFNLINNAVKYTPENGRIIIRAERNNGTACIKVIDNGYGIPAWAHEKIFEKFFQADSIMSQKVGGSGLGLPISRGIVAQHKGRLYCMSPISKTDAAIADFPLDGTRKGSMFVIELPRP